MSSGLAFAVLGGPRGMFGWGLADFSAKKTIDEIGDITTLVWAHVCGAVAILAALLIGQLANSKASTLPHGLSTWLLLGAFGIGQGVVYLLVYRAFAKGGLDVSFASVALVATSR